VARCLPGFIDPRRNRSRQPHKSFRTAVQGEGWNGSVRPRAVAEAFDNYVSKVELAMADWHIEPSLSHRLDDLPADSLSGKEDNHKSNKWQASCVVTSGVGR